MFLCVYFRNIFNCRCGQEEKCELLSSLMNMCIYSTTRILRSHLGLQYCARGWFTGNVLTVPACLCYVVKFCVFSQTWTWLHNKYRHKYRNTYLSGNTQRYSEYRNTCVVKVHEQWCFRLKVSEYTNWRNTSCDEQIIIV